MIFSKSRVERRIVRTYWDDGLLDILSGIVVVLIGIAWHFDLVPLGAVTPAMVVPFWKPLRRWITQPRLGHVEFLDAQTERYRSFLIWSFWIGCLTFCFSILFYFYVANTEQPISLEHWSPAIPAWLIAFALMLVSMVVLVRRFIYYTALFCLLGLLVAVFDQRPEVAMLVGGGAMIVGGALRLLAFIHSCPRQPTELNGA